MISMIINGTIGDFGDLVSLNTSITLSPPKKKILMSDKVY